jgi:hypothetical protein
MKIKGFKDFIVEGLGDLRDRMRTSGQSTQFSPNDFSKKEIIDIISKGGELVDRQTAKLPSGELITKSHLGYGLEKNGTNLIFVRIGMFQTIPSDWEVFNIQLDSYLQDQL